MSAFITVVALKYIREIKIYMWSFFLGIPYNITVYTGDKRNAGTDARVYIVMHNEKKSSSSSQIFLSNGKFERKSIDLCTVDAPEELSPLTALDIGHDNSGAGPGWHLDKVCWRNLINSSPFFFKDNWD